MGKLGDAPQVFLSGGIGNQLFQLAAALRNSSGIVVLNGSFGKPRMANLQSADLSRYQLPNRVMVPNSEPFPWPIRFISDLLLRASSSVKLSPYSITRRILVTASNLCFTIYFRKNIRVKISHGTGFFELEALKPNSILFGFFHTYQFPIELESTEDNLRDLKLKNPSKVLKNLIDESKNKSILVVHVRLGDYKNEPAFGILPTEYFAKAIEFAYSQSSYDEIWLFSATPHEALSYIPKKYQSKARVMEGIVNHPAETLELMRLGEGYVLSNSTYSWWAAYLSRNNPTVICVPQPWFTNAPIPNRLIPDHWSAIQW